MSTFGKRLKQLREDKHLTQKELAEQLSVNRDALAKWETERAFPDLIMVKSIAEFFGVATDYLLGRDHNTFEAQVTEILRNNKDLMSKEEEAFLLAMVINYIETIKKKK
jgi:transcriptional regulator with XRE-family HTH domain